MIEVSGRVLVERVGEDHLVVTDDRTGLSVTLSASRDAASLVAAVAWLASPGDPFGVLADARGTVFEWAESERRAVA